MAISRASYSTGNRVYNGGSSQPNLGTVDPMGYIDRSLNQPSQTRSGIAAAALRRLSGTSTPGSESGAPAPKINTIGGQVGDVGAPAPAPGVTAPVTLTMSPSGKLSAPKLNSATALPFDADSADAQTNLLMQKNRFESDFNSSQNQLERQFGLSLRDTEDQMPDARRQVLENYGGRGLVHSSGYAYDTGELEKQYAKILGDIQAGHTESLADLLRQRGLFNDEYSTKLQQIQAAAARKAAADAANLDLGDGSGVDDPTQSTLDERLGSQQPLSAPLVPATSLAHPYQNGLVQGPDTSVSLPNLTPFTPAMTAPKMMTDQVTRTFTDPSSIAKLKAGGSVTAGNGYVYKLINGVPTRVA